MAELTSVVLAGGGTAGHVNPLLAVADELGPENPFENAFQLRATRLTTEKQARAHLSLETMRTWKIVNENVKNAVGENNRPSHENIPPGLRMAPIHTPDLNPAMAAIAHIVITIDSKRTV